MLQSRAAKRITLTWTDFLSTGFTCTDAPVRATLQFNTPFVNSISSLPEQYADIARKLKNTQKSPRERIYSRVLIFDQTSISSPLFVASREESTPRPSSLLIQRGTQRGTQAIGNGNQRRSRLPTGLPRSPHPCTSGLTPSQAEDVEFETRLASYSDDEPNSMNTNLRKMTKEERRWSKDDAWVDILVASHSRRAGNQDAELRRPGGPRPRNASRQDPEVASQEVAQVLAGIRGPSPPFDGESADIEPMNVPHRSRMDSIGTVLDDICTPTIPDSVDMVEPEEVQVTEPQRPRRRMGYFGLHPEWHHVHVGGDGGDMLDQFAQAAGALVFYSISRNNTMLQ